MERDNTLATVKNLNALPKVMQGEIGQEDLRIRQDILSTLKNKSNECLEALQKIIDENKKLIVIESQNTHDMYLELNEAKAIVKEFKKKNEVLEKQIGMLRHEQKEINEFSARLLDGEQEEEKIGQDQKQKVSQEGQEIEGDQ